ncbi:hypothetical protein [Xenorhabdus sp. PB62.4]|uniref:hypothetical protein n=1 Tax=Xenorhabdus sp. PB62.4 TaxID=1851573 RepID=UPI001656FCD8|nr:hypothetical protein [Xenorhabdus sp. PB62.4]MBC8953752.1 hypothetical protein [Xenorhabdus sp. PB62.4]
MDKVIEVSEEYYRRIKRLTNCIFINKENLVIQSVLNEHFNVISYITEQHGFIEMALETTTLANTKDVNIHICEKKQLSKTYLNMFLS